mmetsp:Transcript_15266/g.33307  ORF Transcript_15266/g.33307 Transcript_15266/m.33307 type:complete len:123 (-) Transcript_15266:52-420(-)
MVALIAIEAMLILSSMVIFKSGVVAAAVLSKALSLPVKVLAIGAANVKEAAVAATSTMVSRKDLIEFLVGACCYKINDEGRLKRVPRKMGGVVGMTQCFACSNFLSPISAYNIVTQIKERCV